MRSFIIVSAIVASAIVSGNIAPVHAADAVKKVRSPVVDASGVTISKQKRCGEEWKATKTQHADLTWPKFWHFCSVTVKANPAEASKPVGQMNIATK